MPQTATLSISRRPTMNSFALYLLSLAAMIGMYSIYARYLVPIIEGAPNIVLQRPAPPNVDLARSQFDKSELLPLITADAWENGECKTLVTSQGTILFQQFERIEGGYLEVLPFTLVTSSESTPKDSNGINPDEVQLRSPPIVLRCLKGARLKFDNPGVDPFSGKSKLESAWLVGDVDIFRPASGPLANDALAVSTSNVQIDKQKIFTIDDVRFSFGSNQGSGKNLSIEFAHADEANQITTGFGSVKGVKRIELAFLDSLRLETPSNNDKPSAVAPVKMDRDGNDNLSLPIVVTCDGPFVFDFDQRTASFRDSVVVELENEFQDKIQCDQLTVAFEQLDAIRRAAKRTSESDGSSAGDWELRTLVAQGLPATIFSVGRAAKITGDLLSYDVSTGEVKAERISTTSPPVTIVSPEFHVTANRIAYEMQPNNELGPVAAEGPGNLLRLATERSAEFFVEWQSGLNVQPDGDQHVISLDGSCCIRLDSVTNIKAEQIRIWLNEVVIEKTAPDGTVSTVNEYQPDKVIAKKNVEIVSERLNGATNKLTAIWQPSDRPLQAQFQIPPAQLKRLQTAALAQAMTVVRRPRYQQQTLNDLEQLAANGGAQYTTPPPIRDNQIAPAGFDQQISVAKKKFAFRGEEVNVKLIYDGELTEIQDLTATGNVSIAEVPSAFAESDIPPLNVTGNFLRCIPQANEQVRILVTGTPNHPAAVDAKRMRLEGQQVHLDQEANKLWIEGAGQVRLENPAAIENGPTNDTQNQAATTANYDRVTVTWASGMVFDGSKVYFEDDVKMEARGKSNDGASVITSAAGEGLSLQMNQAINFRDLESDAQKNKIEIRELVIVDQVASSQRIFKLVKHGNSRTPSKLPAIISNQSLNPAGELIEQQKFLASQVTLNTTSGDINSKGPGVMMIYRRGENQLLKGAKQGTNRPPLNPNAISFIRVNFDGSADANTTTKQLLIKGNVRTLYATVNSFQQIFDPDDSRTLPPEGVKVTCEQLKLVQWKPRNSESPSNELLATGNAHITSGAFEATADRVSYSQSTDMLVIEGTPRSDANLWFRQNPNSTDREHLVAGKILYRISDQWTEVQSVKNMNATINRK